MSPLILAGFALDLCADLLEELTGLTRDVADHLFAMANVRGRTS